MPKVLVVALREYWALVSTKSFFLGLLVAPLLGLLAVALADDDDRPTTEGGPKQMVLIDRSGDLRARIVAMAQGAELEVTVEDEEAVDEQRLLEFGEQLRTGRLLAVVDVPVDVLSRGEEQGVVVYVENMGSTTTRWLDGMITDAIQMQRLHEAGIEESKAVELMKPVNVATRPPPQPETETSEEAAAAGLLIPMITFMLVFMGIMTAATPQLQAVIEEKQQRISEVLLGALAPEQLMLGKLIGTAAVGLTVVAVYVGIGYGVAVSLDYAKFVSAGSIAMAVGISVIAMFMYGAVFLSLGAAANELKDAQGLMMPVMLLLFGPLMAVSRIVAEPHGSLATGLSLFPLTAPMVMPLRLGITQTVPSWQIVIAVVLALATTAAIVWAAGRIFRIGILSQGKMPSLRELAGWIVRG